MQRLEMYYRWLTMRVWVRFAGHGGCWDVEAERLDGSVSVTLCRTVEEAKAKVAELRAEGNRKVCNISHG